MAEAGILEAPAAGTVATDTNIDAPLKGTTPTPIGSLAKQVVPSRDRMASLMKHATPTAKPAEKPKVDKAKPQPEKAAEKASEPESDKVVDDEANRPGNLDSDTEKAKTETDAEPKADAEKSSGTKDWPLLQGYKKENAALKKQLAELQKSKPADDTEKTALADRLETHKKELEAIRKEKKEIEDLLKFRDYQSTPEFQREYVQPWQTAEADAIKYLQGIKVTTETGEEHEITPDEIKWIAGMKIPTARETIRKLFPDARDAADITRHTENLRSLTEKYNSGLQKAWADSDKWHKDQQAKQQEMTVAQQKQAEERTKRFQAVAEENSKFFTEFNDADRAQVEHLQERKGDDEWNARLAKSEADTKLALDGKPNNPDLSAEERKAAIRHNVKQINFMKAAPMLALENKRLKAKLADREKKLAEYESSEPVPGTGKGKAVAALTPVAPSAAREQRLMKYVG